MIPTRYSDSLKNTFFDYAYPMNSQTASRKVSNKQIIQPKRYCERYAIS